MNRIANPVTGHAIAGLPRHGLLLTALLLIANGAAAQSFDSQSDGSDGALDLTGQSGTVVFDPTVLGLDTDGDNVYHFTTITVPVGVTLVLRGDKLNLAPVYWLASGDVVIQGEVDLSGEKGHASGAMVTVRNATPGPGGFFGGVAGTIGGGPSQAGFGPSPGTASTGYGRAGANSSNTYAQPLIGGSGASGGMGYQTCHYGAGGGAGGGALLIASSSLIRVDGTLRADGGASGDLPCTYYPGGQGGGGTLRLLAPTVTGAGTISALPNGMVRTETFGSPFSGTVQVGNQGRVRSVTLSPNATVVPSSGGFPKLTFVRVAGQNAPTTPTGSFLTPDVTINASGAITIDIGAQNIPLNTVVRLDVHNETQTVASVNTTPLTGTLANSTATATVTLPPGFSNLVISASW